ELSGAVESELCSAVGGEELYLLTGKQRIGVKQVPQHKRARASRQSEMQLDLDGYQALRAGLRKRHLTVQAIMEIEDVASLVADHLRAARQCSHCRRRGCRGVGRTGRHI